MENTADDIIFKKMQFHNETEFLFTISEKEYRNKNRKTEAIRCLSEIIC